LLSTVFIVYKKKTLWKAICIIWKIFVFQDCKDGKKRVDNLDYDYYQKAILVSPWTDLDLQRLINGITIVQMVTQYILYSQWVYTPLIFKEYTFLAVQQNILRPFFILIWIIDKAVASYTLHNRMMYFYAPFGWSHIIKNCALFNSSVYLAIIEKKEHQFFFRIVKTHSHQRYKN